MINYVGDTVRLSCICKNFDGLNTDPTALTVTVTKSDNTKVNYTWVDEEITKNATGDFHIDIDLDMSGVWSAVWTAKGTVGKVERIEFNVRDVV